MLLQELYEKLIELHLEFCTEHEAHVAGNKSAGRRARKAVGEIKKLITPYKKESVATDKR
jgi:hypothetical protein